MQPVQKKRTAAATSNGPFLSKSSAGDGEEGNALKLLAYILRAPIRRGFALDQTDVYPATYAEL